jgi:hypothetical protein
MSSHTLSFFYKKVIFIKSYSLSVSQQYHENTQIPL